MQLLDDRFIFSPSDLVNHLACEHLTQLSRLVALGELVRAEDDRSEVQLIRELGDAHEHAYLDELRAEGLSIVEIDDATSETLAQRHDETIAAMRARADVIFQATFFDGTWRGHADFLIKTEATSSSLGDWSYEPYDTKLARTEKVSALVQLADYAHHLEAAQGRTPERVHIVLGDGRVSSFPNHMLAGYHQRARQRVTAAVESAPQSYPDPVDHCKVCRWHERCDEQRRSDDHLVHVAGVGRPQIKSLRSVGIATATALARSADGQKPTGMQQATWQRIRRQAQLQLNAADDNPQFELVDPELHPTGGLRLLPEPTANDLFFDIEGDPYRGFESAGLEYLWGVSDTNDEFRSWWAHDSDQERATFEQCVDHFIDAFAADATMHIYHYASYEVSVLKRLASRFASRIDEVDHLLRNEVFVDLYSVARHSVRTSAESMSIKKLEAFYRNARDTDVQSGMESVVEYERWLESGMSPDSRDQSILDAIWAYNRDDCVSTRQLRDWLEERRAQAIAAGMSIPRPVLAAAAPDSANAAARSQRQAVRDALLAEYDDSDLVSHGRWLLGNLLDFHEREAKPQWWKQFELRAMSPAELWEDSEAVAGLVDQGIVGTVARSNLHELRFDPAQPHKLKPGTMSDYTPDTDGKHRGVTIHEVDAPNGVLLVKQGNRNTDPMPAHLIPAGPVNTESLRDALFEVAQAASGTGLGGFPAIRDLLERRPPRLAAGQSLQGPGEDASASVVRCASLLDESCLAVQGPPGTGKTYTGAHMIIELVREGKKVGVVSNSHRAIENLLAEIVSHDGGTTSILKVRGEAAALAPGIDHSNQPKDAAQQFLDGDYDVVGGTAWFFARPALRNEFDVLVVDEAGQFSLANTIAAATSARNLVLLGDPQQLDQPVQGTHPDGVAVSALSHFIRDEATISPERGIFLDGTWRMDPAVCSFVSETFYDGRLAAAADAPRRSIDGLRSGIYWQPVLHDLNKARAPEEAQQAVTIAESLMGRDFSDGSTSRPLRSSDMMVIAPFNAQVGEIRGAFENAGLGGAQIGTVDLFQGRQAPVVIYSMTSSSGELAPRGIDFLYNGNRFNVAISRAQVAAIAIGNPALLNTNANKPEQMPLVGALCNFVANSMLLVP